MIVFIIGTHLLKRMRLVEFLNTATKHIGLKRLLKVNLKIK